MGRKPQEKVFYAKTAHESNQKARTYLSKENREISPTLDGIRTLGQFLTETFIPEYEANVKANNMSWTAFQNRKGRLERFIIEPLAKYPEVQKAHLGDTVLKYLRPHHVETFFKALDKDGVSPNLRQDLRIDLGLAIKAAKRFIPERPSDYFEDLPKIRLTAPKVKMFDYDLIWKTIADESKPLEARSLVAFQFIMRCRPSEIFALERSDIDLEAGTVTFDKAVRRTENGFEATDGLKTSAGRTVAMGDFLTDLMVQLFRKHRFGVFAFPGPQGKRFDKDSFKYHWARVRLALGLPNGPSFYSLKHSGISWANAEGQSAATQRAVTGHADTRTLERHYTQVPSKAAKEAISLFDRKAQTIRSAEQSASASGQ